MALPPYMSGPLVNYYQHTGNVGAFQQQQMSNQLTSTALVPDPVCIYNYHQRVENEATVLPPQVSGNQSVVSVNERGGTVEVDKVKSIPETKPNRCIKFFVIKEKLQARVYIAGGEDDGILVSSVSPDNIIVRENNNSSFPFDSLSENQKQEFLTHLNTCQIQITSENKSGELEQIKSITILRSSL